jgi:hypothetical protein
MPAEAPRSPDADYDSGCRNETMAVRGVAAGFGQHIRRRLVGTGQTHTPELPETAGSQLLSISVAAIRLYGR